MVFTYITTEPGVLQDFLSALIGVIFVKAESQTWFLSQKLIDKVSKLIRVGNANLIGDLMWLVYDIIVHPRSVPIVERKHACEHLVHYYTNSPPVGRKSVAFALEKLRCKIGRSPREIMRQLVMSEYFGQAEINNLEVAVHIKNQVFHLEIPMHDITFMEVLEAQDELHDIEFDLLFFELFRLIENHRKLSTTDEGHHVV